MKIFLTSDNLDKLREFLVKCGQAFASKKEVEQNDADLNTYVLSISEENYTKYLTIKDD